jgi:hypothetical protein
VLTASLRLKPGDVAIRNGADEELPESGGIYRWLAPVNAVPECRVRHL